MEFSLEGIFQPQRKKRTR